MAWNDESFLIGERARVEGERDLGVITRLDTKRGLIFVLFKRMREEAYKYPEAIDEHKIVPLVTKKEDSSSNF